MTGKRHNGCKLPTLTLKRAKDGKKEYLLNVYSVINGSVCGFPFFLSLYLVSQIEFSNQGFCEVLEIDFQTLLNICLQDGYNATGQIGNPRDLNYQDFVCLLR